VGNVENNLRGKQRYGSAARPYARCTPVLEYDVCRFPLTGAGRGRRKTSILAATVSVRAGRRGPHSQADLAGRDLRPMADETAQVRIWSAVATPLKIIAQLSLVLPQASGHTRKRESQQTRSPRNSLSLRVIAAVDDRKMTQLGARVGEHHGSADDRPLRVRPRIVATSFTLKEQIALQDPRQRAPSRRSSRQCGYECGYADGRWCYTHPPHTVRAGMTREKGSRCSSTGSGWTYKRLSRRYAARSWAHEYGVDPTTAAPRVRCWRQLTRDRSRSFQFTRRCHLDVRTLVGRRLTPVPAAARGSRLRGASTKRMFDTRWTTTA